MWNMQLFMARLVVGSDFRYHQNSASGGAKTSFLDQKWLYFQIHLLSFKDIKHWRPPEDAPWKAAYFRYQALNCLTNIGGLNWGNHLAKTGTKPASTGFSWNQYSRNGPKMEPLLTLPPSYYPRSFSVFSVIMSQPDPTGWYPPLSGVSARWINAIHHCYVVQDDSTMEITSSITRICSSNSDKVQRSAQLGWFYWQFNSGHQIK